MDVKVSDLRNALSLFALPVGDEALFSPLKFVAKSKKLTCAAQSGFKTELVWGEYKADGFAGGEEFIIEPVTVLKFLGRFDPDEGVDFSLKDGVVKLEGKNRTFKVVQQSELTFEAPLRTPPITDGRVSFKDGPVTSILRTTAEALKEIVADAELVEIPYFPIHLGRESYATFGEDQAKHNVARSSIPGKFEGEAVDVVVSESFKNLVANLEGDVELQSKAGKPLAVRKDGLAWLFTPKLKQE